MKNIDWRMVRLVLALTDDVADWADSELSEVIQNSSKISALLESMSQKLNEVHCVVRHRDLVSKFAKFSTGSLLILRQRIFDRVAAKVEEAKSEFSELHYKYTYQIGSVEFALDQVLGDRCDVALSNLPNFKSLMDPS